MPDPNWRLRVATIGESQGTGTGPVGLEGAGRACSPTVLAGAPAGVAGFAVDELTPASGDDDWTEPGGFAVDLLPPSGGGEVGFFSSGIAGKVRPSGAADISEER